MMSQSNRSALVRQIETAVAQDELDRALTLMSQAPEWEDAACMVRWRLGWADRARVSGALAEKDYARWRGEVMAHELLPALRNRAGSAPSLLMPQEQALARLLCNVQRYVTAVNGLRIPDSSSLPTPLRAEQESVEPGHRPLRSTPMPDARDEMDELYRWSQGSLLLLGDPGSGKTFRLMEIAELLLADMRGSPTAVIPLPLDLADWQARSADFAEWVVESANRSFLIERETIRSWLTGHRMALLLDGLNAMSELNERAACVTAINEFVVRYDPPGLVVCSRPQEYAELPARLVAALAVHVEPLDLPEIRAYLMNDQTLAPDLRRALLADSALAQLCETPLGLGVVRDAYAAGVLSIKDTAVPGSTTERRKQLIGQYIDRELERAGVVGEYIQARHWLVWLATQLTEHQKNLLWFERIQPSWLPQGSWRTGYYALTRIGFGLVAGILGGILIGLGLGASAENFQRGLIEGLVGGLAGGISTAFVDCWWQNRFTGLSRQWQRTLLNIGLIFGAVFVSAFLVFMLGRGQIWCPLFGALGMDCPIDAAEAATVASLTAVSFVLVLGVESKEGARSATNDIQCGVVEHLEMSRDRGVRYGLFGLGIGATAGLVMIPVYSAWGSAGNPALMLPEGLYDLSRGKVPMPFLIPFTIAAVCALVGAVFGSITGMAIYPKSRTRPDQPIWLLLRNASTIGVTGAVLGVLLFGSLGRVAETPDAWIYGAFLGFLAFLGYGGFSLFLYLCLRGLLTLKGDTPAVNRYIPFLDAMSDLRLLYRVQGGYRFYHPLWQEYLAQKSEAHTLPFTGADDPRPG